MSLVDLMETSSCLTCNVNLYIEAKRTCLERIDLQLVCKHLRNIKDVCYGIEFEQFFVYLLECDVPFTK
jgi:hypothetical protein